jgi:hypothetical protein
MTKNDKTKNGTDFDKEVYEILQAAGLTFPETPADVEQAEKEQTENPVELPEHLADAAKVLDMMHLKSSDANPKVVLPFSQSNDSRNNLARAAREGSDISTDLAQRMRQDRNKARGKTNGQ